MERSGKISPAGPSSQPVQRANAQSTARSVIAQARKARCIQRWCPAEVSRFRRFHQGRSTAVQASPAASSAAQRDPGGAAPFRHPGGDPEALEGQTGHGHRKTEGAGYAERHREGPVAAGPVLLELIELGERIERAEQRGERCQHDRPDFGEGRPGERPARIRREPAESEKIYQPVEPGHSLEPDRRDRVGDREHQARRVGQRERAGASRSATTWPASMRPARTRPDPREAQAAGRDKRCRRDPDRTRS